MRVSSFDGVKENRDPFRNRCRYKTRSTAIGKKREAKKKNRDPALARKIDAARHSPISAFNLTAVTNEHPAVFSLSSSHGYTILSIPWFGDSLG